MAQALILDSEAINALAAPTKRGALTLRARTIVRVAHERGVPIRVPAAVLAEVCRGARFDAAINQLLSREAILVADLTRQIAQRAGGLLAKAGMSSANAVDAFVVATALDYDSAVIATGDAADLKRLSAPYERVSVMIL